MGRHHQVSVTLCSLLVMMTNDPVPRSHELQPSDQVAASCHSAICDSNLRCSRDCLTAATALHSHSR